MVEGRWCVCVCGGVTRCLIMNLWMGVYMSDGDNGGQHHSEAGGTFTNGSWFIYTSHRTCSWSFGWAPNHGSTSFGVSPIVNFFGGKGGWTEVFSIFVVKRSHSSQSFLFQCVHEDLNFNLKSAKNFPPFSVIDCPGVQDQRVFTEMPTWAKFSYKNLLKPQKVTYFRELALEWREWAREAVCRRPCCMFLVHCFYRWISGVIPPRQLRVPLTQIFPPIPWTRNLHFLFFFSRLFVLCAFSLFGQRETI